MQTTISRSVTEDDLVRFCAEQQARYDTRGTNYGGSRHYAMRGPKYARIVCEEGPPDRVSSRSVVCFVNLANGDILFAAGWKGPAKGVRGNILADDHGASG